MKPRTRGRSPPKPHFIDARQAILAGLGTLTPTPTLIASGRALRGISCLASGPFWLSHIA